MVGDISTVGGYGEERRGEGRGEYDDEAQRNNGMEELVDLVMRYDPIRYDTSE